MLHTILNRTKRNFGLNKPTLNGNVTTDVTVVSNYLCQAARQAFLLKIGEMYNIKMNKRMGKRYPTLLNDIRIVNDYIILLAELHGVKFHERFAYIYKELQIWEAALALSLEYDFQLNKLFKDKIVEYLIGELNYLSFGGRDRIFETRFFTPSLLNVLTDYLIVIYKASNKVNKIDSGILHKLQNLSKSFNSMIK